MIGKRTFSKEHIESLVKKYKADPQIIERSVFALGLLEALVLSGAEFVFKGGSALMILLDKPRRLSTDVDIIVEPGYDIERYIQKASKIYPFIRYKQNIRVGANRIIKKHYRFFYRSLADERKEVPILLDVLFERNHCAGLVKKEIKTEFLETDQAATYATIPDAASILGDKLTAFAPHTIGVLPMKEREDGVIIDKRPEVIKQFFDVASLFDAQYRFEDVLATYKQTAQSEQGYRGLNLTYRDSLMDTFDAALCIASRGKWKSEDYANYLYGIRGIKGYLIKADFNAETAYKEASKVMYLSACLIAETQPPDVALDAPSFSNEYSIINNIRKIDQEAFNLIAKAIELVNG